MVYKQHSSVSSLWPLCLTPSVISELTQIRCFSSDLSRTQHDELSSTPWSESYKTRYLPTIIYTLAIFLAGRTKITSLLSNSHSSDMSKQQLRPQWTTLEQPVLESHGSHSNCQTLVPAFSPPSSLTAVQAHCVLNLSETPSLYILCRHHLLSYLQAPKSLAARVCKRRWPFSSWVQPWSLPRLCSWSAKYSACHAEQWNPELMFSRADHWHPPTAITHGKSYLLLLSCSLRHNHSINNNKKCCGLSHTSYISLIRSDLQQDWILQSCHVMPRTEMSVPDKYAVHINRLKKIFLVFY